jgi:3-phosphoshikimate 1-carboxyvinyltransferase
MSLPGSIEIVPPAHVIQTEISVPGSKSLTNRALILAALAEGVVELRGALWSEDTELMVACLRTLGFGIELAPDPNEWCNRTIRVQGQGGKIPRAGTRNTPLELYVGNAGTVARFLSPLVCLGHGVYRLHGQPRMHERPQAPLFEALRALGYDVESATGRLPVLITGTGPQPGTARLSIRDSSQFASGILLCAKAGQWALELTDARSEDSPYLRMTSQIIAGFPQRGGPVPIEPDASSGSYFYAAGWLLNQPTATRGSRITVRDWPNSGWQIDAEFTRYWPLPAVVSRERDLGDSILTAMILAALSEEPVDFVDLNRLRVQECERVQAMRVELSKCGAQVKESGQTLRINGGNLHGAEIETYNDHRIAMCFSILGLKVPGIKIINPACVRKTFPNYFEKLSAPAPNGLGVQLLDGATGAVLVPSALRMS